MKTLKESQKVIHTLFGEQRLAVLSTAEEEKPYGSLVAFASTEDLKHLLFATTRATRKFGYLSKNPKVALLVDSRKNTAEDFQHASAVTALGVVEETEKTGSLYNVYLEKLPYLKEFVASPTCALIRVTVNKYIIVQNFQTVTEVVVTQ